MIYRLKITLVFKIEKSSLESFWYTKNQSHKNKTEEYYVERGKFYEDRGNIDKAWDWYRRALKINPKYAKASFSMAGVASK